MDKQPDFDTVERTLIERMQALGLSPARRDIGVETGYPGFYLHRGETQAATFNSDDGERALASVEFIAHLDHEREGQFTIADLVTVEGETMEAAMALAANCFMDVTFPALQALFAPEAYQGPKMTISSVSPEGLAIEWTAYTGQTQTAHDVTGEVTEFFRRTPGFALVMDTITGVLHESRPHWCKLYAGQTPKGITVGVSLDGCKTPQGEAEFRSKFPVRPPALSQWSYRAFFLLQPSRTLSADEAQAIRAQVAQHSPAPAPKRKSWWPFGGQA